MILIDPVSNHGHDGQEIRQDTPPREAARRNNPNPSNKVSDVHKDSRSNPTNTRHAGNAKGREDTKESNKSKENSSTQKDNPMKAKGDNFKVENSKNEKTGAFVDKLA